MIHLHHTKQVAVSNLKHKYWDTAAVWLLFHQGYNILLINRISDYNVPVHKIPVYKLFVS